ncbi:HpcH/HpaI aldolase family protein [Celeribacter sp.]|uniref:HpcH/HpaI aldolase family protein n=1 Tax=Celeribacter sp. TaxID=1890673 RepID=UPI003A92C519
MSAGDNSFKAKLKFGETQIGLWMSLGEATTAELCSHAGFDWLVIDAEHGPNGLRDILNQLRAVGTASHPVVRLRNDDRALIKQALDIGAKTLLLPMIETTEQARQAVRSVKYPPEGVRGIGASLARASLYGKRSDYLSRANDGICLLLQVESLAGLDALEGIIAEVGVDGIFIGPADLAADMGYIGNPGAPEVQARVEQALQTIRAYGKAAGILTGDPELAKRYQGMGVEFLAIGTDVGALNAGLAGIRRSFEVA